MAVKSADMYVCSHGGCDRNVQRGKNGLPLLESIVVTLRAPRESSISKRNDTLLSFTQHYVT